jgi:hypothetical protein
MPPKAAKKRQETQVFGAPVEHLQVFPKPFIPPSWSAHIFTMEIMLYFKLLEPIDACQLEGDGQLGKEDFPQIFPTRDLILIQIL